MRVDPKRAEHTSPAMLFVAGNLLRSRYPKARAVTEIIAMAASPLTLVFWPSLRSSIAHTAVIGSTTGRLDVTLRTVAMASAPKATWERPSPMNENLFKTNVVPSSDAHSDTNVSQISA